MQPEVKEKTLRTGLHTNQYPKHYLCFKMESSVTSVKGKM